MAGVFQGLKVIDSATFVAGPAAAVILADFGADVIKVEPVGAGDPQRVLGRLPNLPKADHNYAWTIAARSKRTLGVDLKNETGRTILRQLVRSADVFITNQSPASRTRLGISYEQLSQINPRLVYAALTGYGETGPEAERPGFDAHAYWARSGLADNVRPDSESPPRVTYSGDGRSANGRHALRRNCHGASSPGAHGPGKLRHDFAAGQRSLVECGIDPGGPVRWRDPIPPAADRRPGTL